MPTWQLVPCDEQACARLARALALHPVAARVLVARGLDDPDAAAAFLDPSLDRLSDPFTMHGMDRAVERLLAAAAGGERVLVYGDYDVDGVCAAALLVRALREAGLRCDVYIPHRLEEGYGLHASALEAAAAEGVSLVVTVDTGISGLAAAHRARELGLDLIITDHHELPRELPPALAVLHPRHPQSSYAFPHLSGAGVAWRLVQALAARLHSRAGAGAAPDPAAGLDLVALAAVADVVPLVGENRILVAAGLARMRQEPRPGLAALCEVAGIDPASLDAWHVAFVLAPRLNAAGRMGDARAALELLTADAVAAARPRARALDAENRTRQQVQERILEEARRRAAGDAGRVLVLSDASWHAGVVGIVAARLCEETGRPVLLAVESDGVVHGSARSHPGFPITEALAECADLLEAYGGHDLAAGFRLPAGHLGALRERLDAVYRRVAGERPPERPLVCDAEAALDDVGDRLVQDLQRLAPFGEGNPEPLLWFRQVPVRAARAVGRDGSHLKLRLGDGIDAVAFGQGAAAARLRPGGHVDLAARPRRTLWQGQARVELHVQAVRPVSLPGMPAAPWAPPAPPAPARSPSPDHPDREALASLFRRLRQASEGGDRLSMADAVARLAAGTSLSPRGVRRGLQVFAELGLLQLERDHVRLVESAGKVDLEASPTYRRIAAALGLHRFSVADD